MNAPNREETIARYKELSGEEIRSDDPLIPLYQMLFAVYDSARRKESVPEFNEEKIKAILEESIKTKISLSFKEEGIEALAQNIAKKVTASISQPQEDQDFAKLLRSLERLEHIIKNSNRTEQREDFLKTPAGIATIALSIVNIALVAVILFKG